MRFYSLLARALSIIATSSAVFGEEEQGLSKLIEDYGARIENTLDADRWDIEVKPDSIVVESKFKVEVYNMVSPFEGMKPIAEKYRIELQFKDMLPRREYVELVKKRAEALAIRNYGAETKDEWSKAGEFLRANPLPRYESMGENGRLYWVYVSTYDSPTVSIVPAVAYAEAKAAEVLIDQLFSRLSQ